MYPRLSWSTLKAIEECEQRYLLHRERKRTPIPERYVLVGNVMHYASEQLVLGGVGHEMIVAQAVWDFDRRVREARTLGWDADELHEKRENVKAGVWRLAEIFDELFANVERDLIKPEMHLYSFHPSGWAIEGYIDLAVVTPVPGRVVTDVFDVKTGSSHEAGQLQFYDVLIETYFGRRPERLGWIEPLGRGLVEVPVTPEENHEMKKRIKAALEVITKGEFDTTGFPKKCGRCPSEPFCPATDAARKMEFGV